MSTFYLYLSRTSSKLKQLLLVSQKCKIKDIHEYCDTKLYLHIFKIYLHLFSTDKKVSADSSANTLISSLLYDSLSV